MNPKLEHEMEALNHTFQMAQFDPQKYLKGREERYVWVKPDIMIVRETEDGWWREEQDFKSMPEAVEKQIEKLRQDPTVATGWFNTPRFSRNGGW